MKEETLQKKYKISWNDNVISYIKGVLDGDGYIDWSLSNPKICLDVVSEQFALKFKKSLKSIGLNPHINEKRRIVKFKKSKSYLVHYFIVKATCIESFISDLTNFSSITINQKSKYIEGIIDSEGYYGEIKRVRKGRKDSCEYQCIIGNNDKTLLETVCGYLKELGIINKIHEHPSQAQPRLYIFGKSNTEKLRQCIDSFKFPALVEVL